MASGRNKSCSSYFAADPKNKGKFMNAIRIPNLGYTVPEIPEHPTQVIVNPRTGNAARSKDKQILCRDKTFLLIAVLVIELLAFQLFYLNELERQLENLEQQVEMLLNQPPPQAIIPPHYHEEFKGKDFLAPFDEVEEKEYDGLTL
jgi:hypothetical protein